MKWSNSGMEGVLIVAINTDTWDLKKAKAPYRKFKLA